MIAGKVKKLSRTDFLASSYSFGVSSSKSCENSLPHCWLSESKACEIPPQPTYLERISCSSGVARLSSRSICFKVRMASILLWNLVFAPPSPSLSSVMVKFCDFSSALTSCSGMVFCGVSVVTAFSISGSSADFSDLASR